MNGVTRGRWSVAGLAGLLFLRTGVLASGDACPFLFYDPARGLYTEAPSAEVCGSMRSYLPAFRRLLGAAGFAESDIHLYGQSDPEDNAFYYLRAVYLNTGAIAAHPTPDAAMLYTLAHEIGHAVQDRGGELAWANEVRRETAEGRERSRKIEGQADHIAADLLEKAGLGGAKTALRGVEETYSCPSIAAGPRGLGTHPTNKDRFLLQLKKATLSGPGVPTDLHAAAPQGGAADFDGTGRTASPFKTEPVPAARPSEAAFRPSLGLDGFDAFGRPKNEGLRTAAVPKPGAPRPGTAASGAAPAPPPEAPTRGSAAPPKKPGFWGGMADAAASAGEAAVNAVVDLLWFDNPLVEAVAVKSCGVPKEAGFNEAVKAGWLPWLASQAAEAAETAKDLYAKATGASAGPVDLAFRPNRS